MTDHDEKPEDKPDPIEDVRKGLGLLFRAAKSAVTALPTDKLEEAVLSGAREVGRAIENVTQTIDKQIFKGGKPEASPPTPPTEGAPAADAKPPEAKDEAAKKDEGKPEDADAARGPRIG